MSGKPESATGPQFDVVVPKNPSKLVQCFCKFNNLEQILNDLDAIWAKFRELGKEAKPKTSKKKQAAGAGGEGDDSEKPTKTTKKRQRRAKLTYQQTLEMINSLQVDDNVKHTLVQKVKDLYQETKISDE